MGNRVKTAVKGSLIPVPWPSDDGIVEEFGKGTVDRFPSPRKAFTTLKDDHIDLNGKLYRIDVKGAPCELYPRIDGSFRFYVVCGKGAETIDHDSLYSVLCKALMKYTEGMERAEGIKHSMPVSKRF